MIGEKDLEIKCCFAACCSPNQTSKASLMCTNLSNSANLLHCDLHNYEGSPEIGNSTPFKGGLTICVKLAIYQRLSEGVKKMLVLGLSPK